MRFLSCQEGIGRSVGSIVRDTTVWVFIEDIENIGAIVTLIDRAIERIRTKGIAGVVWGKTKGNAGIAIAGLAKLVLDGIVEDLWHCWDSCG